MTANRSPASGVFQIVLAIILTNLIVALCFGIVMGVNAMVDYMCHTAAGDGVAGLCADAPDPTSTALSAQSKVLSIDSACVDDAELRISVVFDEPLTTDATVQIVSGSGDIFLTPQGLANTYLTTIPIASVTNRLDLIVPVAPLRAGQEVVGTIIISSGGGDSRAAYYLFVSDCQAIETIAVSPTPAINADGTPRLYALTCLESGQLMVSFRFDQPVTGRYRALVAGAPYEATLIADQPSTLFFIGEPPPSEPVVIRLISLPAESIVFEETHTPPYCGTTVTNPGNGSDSSPSSGGTGNDNDDDDDDDDDD